MRLKNPAGEYCVIDDDTLEDVQNKIVAIEFAEFIASEETKDLD